MAPRIHNLLLSGRYGLLILAVCCWGFDCDRCEDIFRVDFSGDVVAVTIDHQGGDTVSVGDSILVEVRIPVSLADENGNLLELEEGPQVQFLFRQVEPSDTVLAVGERVPSESLGREISNNIYREVLHGSNAGFFGYQSELDGDAYAVKLLWRPLQINTYEITAFVQESSINLVLETEEQCFNITEPTIVFDPTSINRAIEYYPNAQESPDLQSILPSLVILEVR